MQFIELQITLPPEYAEILMAELANVGFEAFMDTVTGLNAYIAHELFEESELAILQEKYQDLFNWKYQKIILEKKNWNEEWEQNYNPVTINNICRIRASFHPEDKNYPYEIVINPQMSFGTGHHETTSLMIENQTFVDHKDKDLLDIGCGTGILAIMGAKLGAKHIEAIDIDEWSIENTKENAALNHCANLYVYRETIHKVSLKKEKYNIILANINRNILLAEIPTYVNYLASTGFLVISGFYTQDTQELINLAQQYQLIEIRTIQKNNWSSVIFQKSI